MPEELVMVVTFLAAGFAGWTAVNLYWALIVSFCYWEDLRKLPSHNEMPPKSLRLLDTNTLHPPGGSGSGPALWILEQGIVLDWRKSWFVWVAGKLLGTLRIARGCCQVDRSVADRVTIWVATKNNPHRVGFVVLRFDEYCPHLARLDTWADEQEMPPSIPQS